MLVQSEEMKKSRKFDGSDSFDKNTMLNSENSNQSDGNVDDVSFDMSITSEKKPNLPDVLNFAPTVELTRKFLIEKFEVVLINDVGGSRLPFLLFHLKVDPMIFESNVKTMITSNFEIGVSYYNSAAGKLEPIIEKTDLVAVYMSGEDSNPKTYVCVELDQGTFEEEEQSAAVWTDRSSLPQAKLKKKEARPLNINISDEMVWKIEE
jgi:hypothetical protein